MSEPVRPKRTLVLATSNHAKVAELMCLLGDLPIDLRPIADVLAQPLRVDEDGETFEENALKKACAAADATRLLALADDSGLEVEALGGRPGVRSARFAREGATDSENNVALLEALEALEPHGRSDSTAFRARFRCVLALVDPTPLRARRWWMVEGTCDGTIARTPRGSAGFGYDPLFILAGGNKTLSEFDGEQKNRVSHRGRAVEALRPILRSLSE